MIFAYRVFSTLIYPFLFIFIYYRKFLKKEDPKRFKEKILVSSFNVKKKKSKLIWFHAASIGEFKSIIPIINNLNIKSHHLEFLITTTTLSSANLAEKELEKLSNASHRYLPYDVPFLIEKFLNLWKPDRIFLVDSEIWPNVILKAKKHQIPIALINARLTSKSFNKWMFFSKTAKKIFSVFNLCICSSAKTKNYLEKLNAKNIFFNGNIKFIDNIVEKEIDNLNKDILSKKRFWFAGSTHQEEDIFCIKTHLKLKEKFNDIITIIAPRHIERVKKIENISKKFNLNVQILNKNEEILENKELIIINFFGGLLNYFRHAKSVFIGKSISKKFYKNGGQNPIDAAKLNCKIYHGPYVHNFEEIYEVLKKNNIAKEIEKYEELSKHLFIDLNYPHKKENGSSTHIKRLAEKIFSNTMTLVDDFLFHDAY